MISSMCGRLIIVSWKICPVVHDYKVELQCLQRLSGLKYFRFELNSCSVIKMLRNKGGKVTVSRLTLSTLGKIFTIPSSPSPLNLYHCPGKFSRRHFEFFCLCFPGNRIWYFLQSVSNLHEISNVFWKKKRKKKTSSVYRLLNILDSSTG